jgi:hypothetical protein
LYQGYLKRFHFNDEEPFPDRYLVVTKNAVRVYENKSKASSAYGKPIVAVPLAAVNRVDRVMFDTRDDLRFEHADE